MYYLNLEKCGDNRQLFLRIEFICIIWTAFYVIYIILCSWGLNLFVLFEPMAKRKTINISSWGLNLFVLFELLNYKIFELVRSWGLNLFVLFELGNGNRLQKNCSSGLDNKKKYCYFLGVTLTTTYSHIPSVLIGKPQPTSLELMIFV